MNKVKIDKIEDGNVYYSYVGDDSPIGFITSIEDFERKHGKIDELH